MLASSVRCMTSSKLMRTLSHCLNQAFDTKLVGIFIPLRLVMMMRHGLFGMTGLNSLRRANNFGELSWKHRIEKN